MPLPTFPSDVCWHALNEVMPPWPFKIPFKGVLHRVSTVVGQQCKRLPYDCSQAHPAVQTTVHEALIYSAFLRLPGKVNSKVKNDFVEEIMSVVELTPLRNAIVGLPGEDRSRAASSMQSYRRSKPVSVAHSDVIRCLAWTVSAL